MLFHKLSVECRGHWTLPGINNDQFNDHHTKIKDMNVAAVEKIVNMKFHVFFSKDLFVSLYQVEEPFEIQLFVFETS